MMHLIAQIIIIAGWLIVIPYIYFNRHNTGLNTIYLKLFSSIMILSSLISELLQNNWDMTWNSWSWYPTNIALQILFYLTVRDRKKEFNSLKNFFNNEK